MAQLMLEELAGDRRTNAQRSRWLAVSSEERLMTAQLYGLWGLSIVLALIVEFLTPGRFTLLPVPW
jgi:hypothetical protein